MPPLLQGVRQLSWRQRGIVLLICLGLWGLSWGLETLRPPTIPETSPLTQPSP